MTHLNWAWFCVRSQQKHELVAASHLRLLENVEVFNPRVYFARRIRQRKVWVTEPLFPGYLFARFNWRESLCKVYYAPGVQCVVHFGNGWPTVPDKVMEEIRALVGPNETHLLSDEMTAGEEVQIIGGMFDSLTAVITQVMPGRQRVAVLLDFLGRQTAVEVGIHSIVKPRLRG